MLETPLKDLRRYSVKTLIAALVTLTALVLHAQDLSQRAREMEMKGDGAGARALLQQAANENPPRPEAMKAYAEFLDRHRDPAAGELYERLLTVAAGQERADVAHHLLLIDARNGDWTAAQKHMDIYKSAGGTGMAVPNPPANDAKKQVILIPGPLRSFARMAALSPELKVDELLG